MKTQLHAYLGINALGDLALYVSTGRLNPVGPRLENGTPLPQSVYEFDPIHLAEDTDYAVAALGELQDYFNNQVKEKKRK